MARLELKGTAVAPGVGIGRAHVVVEETARVPRRALAGESSGQAADRFETARQRAIAALKGVQAVTSRELGIQDAAIYGAQIAVLQDPDGLRFIRERIEEDQLEPESAVQALIDRFEHLFRGLEGGDVKNWVADLRDPWRAVIRELSEEEEQRLTGADDAGLVLVAEELTPSLVTRHYRHPLDGIICTRGGRFSHGAVLARSFGIPTVIGIEEIHVKVATGECCILYADEGRVLLGAEDDQEQEARQLAEERLQVRSALASAAREPGATADEVAVQVLVNIESPRDLETFEPETAAGVGLFRTEFAYMERPSFPSEKDQTAIYESILERFPGKPVVFRTLDIGGDKQLRYFRTPREPNPALGWRGLRLSLEWQDLFLMQVSALQAAGRKGDVRLLLPMVTTIDELRLAKQLIDQVRDSSGDDRPPIPVGIMLEVPAAAMALEDLAREVDFVSVGTNDLTQYLFAVDRDNPWVSDLYQPYHPAHLRVLRYVARVCQHQGRVLSVCGEMAGQLAGALFLVGSGYRSLSMAPPFVAEVKAILREVKLEELQELAKRAADCHTSVEAFGLLQDAATRYWRQIVQKAALRA